MTKREHQPLGYEPRADRRRPEPLPCAAMIVVMAALLVALALVGGGIAMALSNQSTPEAIPTLAALPSATPTDVIQPTATNTRIPPTPTVDAWGATGTAIAQATASPTWDYCWWLTPSPTPSPTLPFTPDPWGRTGTAVYLATHPYQTPTPPPARELCFEYPTWTPTSNATATLTPMPIRGRADAGEPDNEPSPEFTMATFEPPPTWTKTPGAPMQESQPQQPIIREVVITAPPPAPVIITAAPIVLTSPPIVIQLPVVITATASPTVTASPTPTNTPEPPTATATPTYTVTPSLTPTNTPEPPTVTPEGGE